MFTPGYTKIRHKSGLKFYAPNLSALGNKRHSRSLKRTATEALEYARRWAREAERLGVQYATQKG
jgi:hypothetical protein